MQQHLGRELRGVAVGSTISWDLGKPSLCSVRRSDDRPASLGSRAEYQDDRDSHEEVDTKLLEREYITGRLLAFGVAPFPPDAECGNVRNRIRHHRDWAFPIRAFTYSRGPSAVTASLQMSELGARHGTPVGRTNTARRDRLAGWRCEG